MSGSSDDHKLVSAKSAINSFLDDLLADVPEEEETVSEESVYEEFAAPVEAVSKVAEPPVPPQSKVSVSTPAQPAAQAFEAPVARQQEVITPVIKPLMVPPVAPPQAKVEPKHAPVEPKIAVKAPEPVAPPKQVEPAPVKVEPKVEAAPKVEVKAEPKVEVPVQAPVETKPAPVEPVAPPAPVEPEQPVATPVIERKPEEPVESQWDKPYPRWAAPDFQALLFDIQGLSLAVPLVKLNGVINWTDAVTPIPNHPAWFMGLLDHRDKKVKVIDTAAMVLPPHKYQQAQSVPHKHIIVVGNGEWGITASALGDVIRLEPGEVKWRTAQGTRPWLAGTVLQKLCALMDADAFTEMLNVANQSK